MKRLSVNLGGSSRRGNLLPSPHRVGPPRAQRLVNRHPKHVCPLVAGHLCQKLLGYASSLHLYAEEIDPRSGRHLGNFPQAFTHLALINAVMHVIRAEQESTTPRDKTTSPRATP